MGTNDSRIDRERKTVGAMIKLYCSEQHGSQRGLCKECDALLQYADERLSACPLAPDKPTCENCPIHCYNGPNREGIRRVMQYSGPRMLRSHPILALRHLVQARKERGIIRALLATGKGKDESHSKG
jgi:hypothetical protein